ncbi:hypothetical protein [Slackia heliotrinireducens]|uniref:Uncharacterized protein n=1 Tax=Slackia heliotrinireducens (strain ATCC 29202 / DSM 20476 / NCTC 11029 / RHS 1) TaxID=471855 RepID=C7N7R5_SLAHD|nr:hypothetical protein [Slackia heliotrinireducens]ACV22950.1 hypothetical protein Shel_19340 [Slackia heliotrinireducens DSM 20476]VEH01793.1 Uncharacterised protein [Slackia heliotrinireducens]
MTLYWHDKKVALNIVDDVSATPHLQEILPDYTVIEATCAQLSTQDGVNEVGAELREAMGMEPLELDDRFLRKQRNLMDRLGMV